MHGPGTTYESQTNDESLGSPTVARPRVALQTHPLFNYVVLLLVQSFVNTVPLLSVTTELDIFVGVPENS